MFQDLQCQLQQLMRSAENNFNQNMNAFRSEMNSIRNTSTVQQVLQSLVNRITNR
jgi:hypothetical protein